MNPGRALCLSLNSCCSPLLSQYHKGFLTTLSHPNHRLSGEDEIEICEESANGCKFLLFYWFPEGTILSGGPHSAFSNLLNILAELFLVCMASGTYCQYTHSIFPWREWLFPRLWIRWLSYNLNLFGRFRESCDFTNYSDIFVLTVKSMLFPAFYILIGS